MGKLFTSLRSRLILLVILTLIPSVLFLVRGSLQRREQARLDAQNEVIHLGRVASRMQTEMVENVKAFLLTVAHQPSIRQQDMSECKSIFAHLVDQHYRYFSSFYVADLQGNLLCTPEEVHHAPKFEACDHYKMLVEADDFVYTGYHVCNTTGLAVLSVGYPITNLQDERVMVTNVSIDLAWFYDFAADIGLPEGAVLVVLDEQGVILSHYPDNDRWRGYKLPKATVLWDLFTKKEGTMIGQGLDGKESIFAMSTMDGSTGKFYVALGMPTEVAYAEGNREMMINLVVLLGVMAAVLILMWVLGDVIIVKQAKTLVKTTQTLAAGDLTARSGLDYSKGELGQLAEAFDHMADQLVKREAERDHNEATLHEYAGNLERTNQELRDFTNIASHDLQEPLRKIQTFGELLIERCAPNLDEQGVDYVHRMQGAAQRMQSLVGELLTYSRVTSKARPFSRVDLNQVARQVLADLDYQIDQKNADVKVTELPVVEADPVQMTQLLQNLIGNALKFHRKDQSPVVRVFMTRAVNGQNSNGMCEIRVSDQGIGFDERYLERIFQPFQRLHAREEFEGTGMGLAICRKIVDRHGGTITATSTPGSGSTFIIQLPLNQKLKGQVPYEH